MMICRAARWMGFLQIAFPLGRTFTPFPCLGMDPFQARIRRREGGEWKEGKRIGTTKGPKARMDGGKRARVVVPEWWQKPKRGGRSDQTGGGSELRKHGRGKKEVRASSNSCRAQKGRSVRRRC
ncbi:hypothetical protein BDV09DRAFT_98737 [Aspergillus tetrazonus]